MCILASLKCKFDWQYLWIPRHYTFPPFLCDKKNLEKNRKRESETGLWNDSSLGVEERIDSQIFHSFPFLPLSVSPFALFVKIVFLSRVTSDPLAAAHMFALKAHDWIMPVFVKWGEETFAKSWPWGTLFLCGLIWVVPAKHTAKKDSWKYFLRISLWKDFIWFLWYLFNPFHSNSGTHTKKNSLCSLV